MIPEWFIIEDYKDLIKIEDVSVWAYLFSERDKEYDNNNLPTIRTINPKKWVDGIPRTIWREGVLSYGGHGHETHSYLESFVQKYANKGEFIPENELHEFKQKEKGGIYISYKSGYFFFKNKQLADEYAEAKKAMFSRTIELAINLRMPKDRIMEEVERLIDDGQKRFYGEIERIKIGCEYPRTWALGLACFDLENDGISRYKIAQFMIPEWINGQVLSEKKVPDSAAKDRVTKALKSVKPFINGGWRVLSGDPPISSQTDLINIK